MKQVMTYKMTRKEGTIAGLALTLQEMGSEWEWSEKCIYQLTLALDEIITNTLNYGYQHPGMHEIEVTVETQEQFVRLEVRDNAEPFNPLVNVPLPELNKSPLERRVGGLGVHIVRMLMDTVDYRYENGRNILSMVKNIDTQTC